MSSGLMSFGDMNKTILVGNEGPFYNSCSIMDIVDSIPGSPLI